MELIDPAIKKAFDSRATSNGYSEKKNVWFDFRIGMAEEGWKEMKSGAPAKEGGYVTPVDAPPVGQASVHRAHFLDELVKLVPEEVARFGKRVEKVEEKGDKLQMTFQDGTIAEADAVIGCDGVKSKARHIVLGENHPATLPQFTGKYAYRGLIPMEKAAQVVGDELARNSQMYLGHHGHVSLTSTADVGSPEINTAIDFDLPNREGSYYECGCLPIETRWKMGRRKMGASHEGVRYV